MLISEVAQRAGIRPSAIRYYESIGLLPQPHRINGRRQYGGDVLDRLRLIRFGLNTGFSLKEMGVLMSNFGSKLTRRKAAHNKIRELKAARERISLMKRMLEQIKLCQCGTLGEAAKRVMEL